jgi:hypothetical protein
MLGRSKHCCLFHLVRRAKRRKQARETALNKGAGHEIKRYAACSTVVHPRHNERGSCMGRTLAEEHGQTERTWRKLPCMAPCALHAPAGSLCTHGMLHRQHSRATCMSASHHGKLPSYIPHARLARAQGSVSLQLLSEGHLEYPAHQVRSVRGLRLVPGMFLSGCGDLPTQE